MAAAPLFAAVFGPGTAFRLPPGAAAGGASRPLLVPFMGVEEPLGVSVGVGSTTWAGVSGDDAGLDDSEDFDDGSWGNLDSSSDGSGRTMILDFAVAVLEVDIVSGRRRRRRGRGRRAAGAPWWW